MLTQFEFYFCSKLIGLKLTRILQLISSFVYENVVIYLYMYKLQFVKLSLRLKLIIARTTTESVIRTPRNVFTAVTCRNAFHELTVFCVPFANIIKHFSLNCTIIIVIIVIRKRNDLCGFSVWIKTFKRNEKTANKSLMQNKFLTFRVLSSNWNINRIRNSFRTRYIVFTYRFKRRTFFENDKLLLYLLGINTYIHFLHFYTSCNQAQVF